ncbi:hypothetical protein [Nonomuraea sp. NPDC049784]|uniref:hypothetical protein n=1 Tax=Nonomuraea sp. NPDC049784 TaxID=3154361 RepID=UPI0033E12D78
MTPLAEISNQELAAMHLGYNYGDEAVAAEFHQRFPILAGWSQAIAYLFKIHFDAHGWTGRGFGMLERGAPPDAVALKQEYTRMVQRVAAGEQSP